MALAEVCVQWQAFVLAVLRLFSSAVCSGWLIWGDHDRRNWKDLAGGECEIFVGTTTTCFLRG